MDGNRLPKRLAFTLMPLALGAALAGCAGEPVEEATEGMGDGDGAGAGNASQMDAACVAQAENDTTVRSVATIIIGGSSASGMGPATTITECPHASTGA